MGDADFLVVAEEAGDPREELGGVGFGYHVACAAAVGVESVDDAAPGGVGTLCEFELVGLDAVEEGEGGCLGVYFDEVGDCFHGGARYVRGVELVESEGVHARR